MKKLFIPSAVLLTALILNSCGEEKKAAPVEAEPAIETFELTKEKLSSQLSLPAEVSGFRQVDLYAKVASYVKDLKVDIGSVVKEGQLLIELEAPEISSQLAAAQSRLHSMEAVYTASNATYNRILETSKVEGTISKNDIDLALSRKSSDYAQLQAAKASVREIQVNQGYLQIRAPFTGVVTSRNVNIGAYVGPAGKGSDLPLLTVQDQKKLRVAVSVPEMYTGYLKNGDEMSFTVRSLPNETFKAKIQRMSGALDLRLRSERVEMDVVNTNNQLLPGMVAEVLLPLNSKESTFVVPKSAIINTSEGVFVIRVKGNKAERVAVKKGRDADDKTEIFGDLTPNEKLVKQASEELRDGTEIKN
ncbi:RND transporter [Flavobacterium psychrophilum]|nr:RND transporter [Flavobacterium psychrophilum]AOE51080.1 RND transporter [Flavobacterium psychrophilum]